MFDIIDVSRHQGVIDFNKVKAAGIQGVIIKAGGADDGLYTDRKWEENYNKATAAGLPVGAYYFTGRNFYGRQEGKAEAAHFYSIIAGKRFQYPVYIDVEAVPVSAGKDAITEAVVAFGEYLEAKGYYVGVYGSEVSGFAERMDINKVSRFSFWVANYSRIPKITYDMWQKGQSNVNGISGAVDVNFCKVDFPALFKKYGFNPTADKEEPGENNGENTGDNNGGRFELLATSAADCDLIRLFCAENYIEYKRL